MAELKDSGARREFESGAVRDIAEGKGRCDLLPLDIVGELMNVYSIDDESQKSYRIEEDISEILKSINKFIRMGNTIDIYNAIGYFIEISEFKTIPMAMIEVSKHYEDGARKYAERNWEKGISCHCYVDSGVRHLLKWLDGWNDEPHDRAFIWNMLGLLWTVKHRPECNDLPYASEFSKQNNDNDLVLVEAYNGNKIYRNAKTGEFIEASDAEDKEFGTWDERLNKGE